MKNINTIKCIQYAISFCCHAEITHVSYFSNNENMIISELVKMN